MDQWTRMFKNICILLWCGWILVATPFMVFGAGGAVEGLVALVVCIYAIAIPAHWLEPQEIIMKIKEDIQTMWERGISVHVIAKKYSCEPIDIMRILGIWE